MKWVKEQKTLLKSVILLLDIIMWKSQLKLSRIRHRGVEHTFRFRTQPTKSVNDSWRLKAVNNFRKKAQFQMFDWILQTPMRHQVPMACLIRHKPGLFFWHHFTTPPKNTFWKIEKKRTKFRTCTTLLYRSWKQVG